MIASAEIDKLATAFAAAQAELKNAVFDKLNPHFKSRYATLPGTRDSVVPVLSKHGLSIVQGAECLATGPVITTRMMHVSGQWIESQYPFQLDKPQQMGSAMTYARRYSLAAICGIASEEDDDANTAQESTYAAPANQSLPPIHNNTKSNSRDEMQALCKEINDIQSMAALQRWKENPDNIKRQEALNDALFMTVKNSFQDKRRELAEKAAA